MRRILHTLRVAVLGLVFASVVLAPATPAFAESVFGDVCTSGQARSSTVCRTPGGDPITSKDGILHSITTVIAIIGGVVSVVVIVLGGIKYIISYGNPEQVATAKRTIIYAVVGLVIIVSGQALINFVIQGI